MKKESIVMSFPEPSRVQCYTREDLEVLFQCGKDPVAMWIDAGLIRGIKSGLRQVFPEFEVLRFQQEMLGKDISNEFAVIDEKRRQERK